MSSVFRIDDNYVDKPKRNVFDLSCQNNLTLNFGKIVPVLCKEVLPGDSFKIEPTFGLRYLPQVFPVQTRQRASIKYYYVRNRNLWKDWPDFIGKTKQGLTPPYLKFSGRNKNLLSPSSMADYMGLPVRIKPTRVNAVQSIEFSHPDYIIGNGLALVPNGSVVFSNRYDDPLTTVTFKSIDTSFLDFTADYAYKLSDVYGGYNDGTSIIPPSTASTDQNFYDEVGATGSFDANNTYFFLYRKPIVVREGSVEFSRPASNESGNRLKYFAILRSDDGTDYVIPFSQDYEYHRQYTCRIWNAASQDFEEKDINFNMIVGFVALGVGTRIDRIPQVLDCSLRGLLSDNPELCWCDVSYDYFPYASDVHPDALRVCALAFRAVQSAYNALIRNAENNPLIINGQPEYNKYVISDEGGATAVDDLLNIYHPNWSDDRFTTALPSPQQGNAPLVGLTGVQGATLTLSSEDGTRSTVHLQVDSASGNVVMVEGVDNGSADYMQDAMMSAVDFGITINDLRNVNSFQKWLENNIRRGYKYKDQLMSHYGVSARYDVLDMPEFLGGVSRDVNVQQVTQTVENDYGNLGDIAGQSYIMGDGHSIEKYCDEHGFIIGLMTVYPMPLYQDTLPKHFIKNDALDYYFPEFGKIGPQPITCKELAFSQSFFEGKMDSTFGYQRAWYDYLESLDEVHGLYHDEFRNYLIGRDFDRVPNLGVNFLTIDNDDLNNTFYSLDDKDKMLGQIYHKITVKRCIPLLGIPSLE